VYCNADADVDKGDGLDMGTHTMSCKLIDAGRRPGVPVPVLGNYDSHERGAALVLLSGAPAPPQTINFLGRLLPRRRPRNAVT